MTLKTEYQIIRMNRWYAGEIAEHPLTGQVKQQPEPDLMDRTLEEVRDHLIAERIEKLRPQARWQDVAESLGVSMKYLRKWRRNHDYTIDKTQRAVGSDDGA